MKDNLPEINVKGPKEKKGGFLGFLRGLGGGGARGVSGIGASSSAGIGAAGAGAAGGGLLGGNVGALVVAGIIAVAGGSYVIRRAAPVPDAQQASAAAAKGAGGQEQEYVPAILRNTANQGSSLAVFTETNKGSGLSLEENAKKAAKPENSDAEADAAMKEADAATSGAGDAMAEAMGGEGPGGLGGASTLSSSVGGGGSSNRMNFGSRMGGGGMGKPELSKNIGTGFQAMPRFQDRKSKMLAMKGASRPVFTSGKTGKSSRFGGNNKGNRQLKALQARQQSYTGSNASSLRSNQDAAWEGTTGAGLADGEGGDGMGEGQDVVTSPSMDNAGGSSSGGGDTGPGIIPEVKNCQQDPNQYGCESIAPWEGLANACEKLVYASAALATIGAGLITLAYGLEGSVFGAEAGAAIHAIGMFLCGVAALLAAIALGCAIALGVKYGQALSATFYGIGAGLAATGAILAMTGEPESAFISTMWWTAGAGVSGLIASMLG